MHSPILPAPEGLPGPFLWISRSIGSSVAANIRSSHAVLPIYSLSDQTPSLSLTATGSVDALAERTAEWLEAVLARPVVLYVWLHDGYAYAARYAFADTSETLAQSYSADRAPSGQYAAVIAAGHVQGRGWLQTAGLPTPDLYLHIRGDMESAAIPAGVHAETRRGPLPGRWYE